MRIEDLNFEAMSPDMREQIMAKVALNEVKRRRKYGNVPTVQNGIRFDSVKESRHFQDLLVLLNQGMISDLKLQPEFTLQEAFMTPAGEKVRAIRYRADFSYTERGQLIVEDVKSEATRKNKVYVMKRKMMEDRGYHVREVT